MSKDLRNGLIFEAIGYLVCILPYVIFLQEATPRLGIIPVIFLFIGSGPYLIGATIILLSEENLRRKLFATILPIILFIPLTFLIWLLSERASGS